MQKMMSTPAGIQVQLVFWRMMVMLAEFALEHRRAVHLILRYAPMLLWGTAAYLMGLVAGEILQIILF